jgi:protein involved in polysaccharide export with SLBB domain
MNLRHASVILLVLTAALNPREAKAQLDASQTARQPYATRDQLVSAQTQLTRAAESPAYSARLRARAADAAADVGRRMREGDLRFGDRIVVRVAGQETLSDTFSVTVGRRLELPGLRPIELMGVLRAELQDRMVSSIREVYRGADVRADALMLVGVLGGVSRPGFYHVPPEALLEEIVMAAGGFASDATSRVAIERGDSIVIRESDADAALRSGRNIGSLGVTSGDAIVVRRQRPADAERVLRAVTMAISIPASLVAAVAIFR